MEKFVNIPATSGGDVHLPSSGYGHSFNWTGRESPTSWP